MQGCPLTENTKKLEKARMRGGQGVQGVQGCLGGVQGVPGGSRGSRGGEVLGGKTAKNEKTRKTVRNCILDVVQEVPVGQMAQGTPFRCLPRCWDTLSKCWRIPVFCVRVSATWGPTLGPLYQGSD